MAFLAVLLCFTNKKLAQIHPPKIIQAQVASAICLVAQQDFAVTFGRDVTVSQNFLLVQHKVV